MKKYIFLLMTTLLMTVFGSSPAWGQTGETTLVDFDFTNNEKFPTSTPFANNGETMLTVDSHDIYFYHNSTKKATFSLSSSGLTFGDNNMESNYFVAIPLKGIHGEITVTFYHKYSESKASYRYNIDDGATDYDVSKGNVKTSVTDNSETDVKITKTFQVNSENAVFYFGRNGSSYTEIKGIKITTPETASNPKLTTFEFNNDDILYYCNTTGNTAAGRSAATSVSTTFEKNDDYGENGYLRVKVNIEPDFSALTNPSFTIESSNKNVLSTTGVTAYYKASDNRMYIDGVKVVGIGSATLTVTFNGSDNYDGTTETTSNTITVIAATAPTLSLTIPTSTTNAEIGSVIELTANKAFSLVEGQYTTRDGINYIAGTINGNTRDFAVDLTKHTLTYTNEMTFVPNTLYEIVIPAGKISSSSLTNTEQTLSFTTAAPDALTPVNEKLWDFETADGFPASTLSETAIIDNMELVANSDRKMSFDNIAKSYTEGDDTYDFTRQLKFGGTGASDGAYRVIHFKVAAGSTVNVFGSTAGSSERTAAIRVAANGKKFSEGEEKVTISSNSSALEKGSFTVDTENYPKGADIWVYSKNSGFNISGIEVTTSKPKLTLSNSGQVTSYVYSDSGENSQSYAITYSYSGDTNLTANDLSKFKITTSNEAVIKTSGAAVTLDTNSKTFSITGLEVRQAGTATLTFKFEGNDTYAESSLSVPFTVTGKLPFSVSLEDMNIQQRQRRTIMPTITNASGNPIGFDASGNVVEMAADDDPVDYDTYFDFTYSLGSNSIGVTLDGNVLRAGNEVGGPVVVTVTATVKTEYAGKFTNSTASGTLNATVTERTTGMYFDFYLDKECTQKVSDVYSTDIDGSTTIVEDFPNGRVLYLKVNEAGIAQNVKEIWFSTGKNTTPVAVSRYVRDGEARTIYKDDPSKSQYLYKMDGGALPIYIDETLSGNDYVFVNVQCYKEVAGSYEQAGSVIPVKFNIVSHDRPADVTYDPTSTGTTVRNTAQTVVAKGDEGNTVYAKFSSTGTNYTIEGLINEPHVFEGITKTGVFSTEVAGRKISGVQVQNYGGEPFIGKMTSASYVYRFATTLNVTPKTQTVQKSASATKPTVTATYYDKVQKKDIDESASGTITYTVVSNSTTGSSGDATTVAADGTITVGTEPGTVVVKVRYSNSKSITVNKRTSIMDNAETYYTIYVTDPEAYLPTITPDSKKFYPTLTATITANTARQAYYTTDGTDPTDPTSSSTRTLLAAGASASYICNESGTMSAGDKITIKAVSYNSETKQYGKVISETYTLGAEVLPPYFVPSGNGTVPNYGDYTYYTETLPVEARVNTAGASIYYTVDGSEPEIGGATTLLYDGLRGLTITGTGTTTIKAFAYNEEIQSQTVTATYTYSNMAAPYFDVNGTGNHTSGVHAVSTSDIITIGSSVVPSPGTTLKHYFTLDGTDPAEDGGTLYTKGFNVIKTVTAKAYSVLTDANGNEVQQSAVTTVTFTVSSAHNVWEAVEATTPGGFMKDYEENATYDKTTKTGKDPEGGFVISTNADLSVTNTGTRVNARSVTGYAQEDITVTFGGYDRKNWFDEPISDAGIGSPIDGVGTYSIKVDGENAQMEVKVEDLSGVKNPHNYNHVYSYKNHAHGETGGTPTASQKTFRVPSYGGYVRFEPEKDGELTIWALQNGSLNFHEGTTLCDKFIRFRPVYFVDEHGNSLKAKEAISSARLSSEWEKIEATATANSWTEYGDSLTIMHRGATTSVKNSGMSKAESAALYQLYKKYLTDNNINIGDPINPFPIHTGTSISQNNGTYVDNSNDGTGYVMLTAGYVRYKFDVKAGKTYYFFAVASKIGIRGFQFVPTEKTNTVVNITDTSDKYSVGGAEKTPSEAVTATEVVPADVTLTRTTPFESGKWTGLVLPFSVSTTQIEQAFGAETSIIHFRNVTKEGLDYKLHFTKHLHQMLVAGTPVIIKPGKGFTTTNSVTFNGVHLEASAVNPMVDGTYTMMGTLIQGGQSLVANDYFFTKTGILKRWTGGNTAMKGTQAWLRPTDPSFAPMLVIGNMTGDDDETTGLFNIEIEDLTTGETYGLTNGVYDLRGRKVSEGSLSGLPKGVYIVNGKKTVIE